MSCFGNKIHQFSYLNKFKCLAENCPDDCCYGWSVRVDHNTHHLYKNKAPELLEYVEKQNNSYFIKKDVDQEQCIKMVKGLCSVQLEYGKEYMSNTCLLYPRIRHNIKGNIMVAASLSCPEITRLCLFTNNPFKIDIGQLDRLTEIKDISRYGECNTKNIIYINQKFIKFCRNKNASAEQILLRVILIVDKLDQLSKKKWIYMIQKLLRLPIKYMYKPIYDKNLPFKLVEIALMMLNSSKKIKRRRLYDILDNIEKVLNIKIDQDIAKVTLGKNSIKIYQSLVNIWRSNLYISDVLKKYMQAYIAMELFPYGKPHITLYDQIIIFTYKFLFIKLALITSLKADSAKSDQDNTVVNIIQGISKYLDHTKNTHIILKKFDEYQYQNISILEGILLV